MSTDKSPSKEAAELREKLEGLRATDPAPHVEAAKQQVADTASTVAANVSDTVSQTASTVKQTAANVRDTLAGATARVADTVGQGADAVRGAVATARGKVRQANDGAEALSERIRDQPFLALGLAVLTGYVLGRAVR